MHEPSAAPPGDVPSRPPIDVPTDAPGIPAGDVDPASRPALDLDRLARELADVERALERLDDGTYWTDELTGQPIADDVLAVDPTARRNPS